MMAAGTALRVLDTEKGDTTVVLLHGYLEMIEVWEELAGALQTNYRVVAIDLPGMGVSQVQGEVHTMEFMAEVLTGVLDKLQIERCFLLGHSMGGYVAEAFAVTHPERVQGLILLHSTPNADTEQKKENRRREIALVKADKKELITQMFASKGFAPANRERLKARIEQLSELMAMNDSEGIVAVLNGLIQRVDQHEMMRKLKVPQLFIFGREDEFIPVEAAEQIIAAQPQAQIAWLEHSGHMGFYEEPGRVLEILEQFIERYK